MLRQTLVMVTTGPGVPGFSKAEPPLNQVFEPGYCHWKCTVASSLPARDHVPRYWAHVLAVNLIDEPRAAVEWDAQR